MKTNKNNHFDANDVCDLVVCRRFSIESHSIREYWKAAVVHHLGHHNNSSSPYLQNGNRYENEVIKLQSQSQSQSQMNHFISRHSFVNSWGQNLLKCLIMPHIYLFTFDIKISKSNRPIQSNIAKLAKHLSDGHGQFIESISPMPNERRESRTDEEKGL